MHIDNGISMFDVEREVHLSYVRRARLVVRRYSLIEAYIGYFLDSGAFKWEVVWRCTAAHHARRFCQVIMSKRDWDLLDLEEVCGRGSNVEMMKFAETSVDQRLLKAV